MANERTIKAEPVTWQVDCPAKGCDGFVNPARSGVGRSMWNQGDFNARGSGTGTCDTCGLTFTVTR